MVGYASDETPRLMPLPLQLAQRLSMRLAEVRKKISSLPRPRRQDPGDRGIPRRQAGPHRDHRGLLPAHRGDPGQERPPDHREVRRKEIIDAVIMPIVDKKMIDKNTNIYINPTGKFVVGGPQSDTGVTGRKIIVDTYGGVAPHGGGAFSGKDSTKVDRSAAYMARYIAKNIVAARLAREVTVQLAYRHRRG